MTYKENTMFGFGDKNKVHKVTIANTGETFEVTGKINLLQAAKNAGVDWPCDCKVGSCGTCRAVLVEGKVKELADFAYTLDGDMLKAGYILACQASLKSDITVELDKDQKKLETLTM
jgi:ferredoxin